MPKTVLLTGGAGFIGAHTIEHILENTDWNIIVADALRLDGGWYRVNQVTAKRPGWYQRVKMVRIDLASEGQMRATRWLDPEDTIDYIINMASDSHVDNSISDPLPFVTNNVLLTLHMLEFARAIKPEVFIQVSTDEVYGPMVRKKTFKEWDRMLPSNPYAASKAAQEMFAISYWRTYGVPVVITNTMNNIGEMQDVEKFVPMLIRDLLAGKKAKVHGKPGNIGSRFYLHARNHADALLFLLKRTPTAYSPTELFPDRYNITGEVQIDNLMMAGLIAKLLKVPLKYQFVDFHSTRPGHDPHYGLNGEKIKSLGWTAPFSFMESLERTVENYVKHPDWLK